MIQENSQLISSICDLLQTECTIRVAFIGFCFDDFCGLLIDELHGQLNLSVGHII